MFNNAKKNTFVTEIESIYKQAQTDYFNSLIPSGLSFVDYTYVRKDKYVVVDYKLKDIDIPVPYELEVETIEPILESITEKISLLENVEDAKYKGVNEFADSATMYKIRIHCNPEFKPQIKRDANRIIKVEFDSNGIHIPYKQVDIHNK